MEILQLILNWKTLLATGAAVSCVILAKKVEPMDAGRTLEAGFDATSDILGSGFAVMKKR